MSYPTTYVVETEIEPATSSLALLPRFELRTTDSESAMLPLHYRSKTNLRSGSWDRTNDGSDSKSELRTNTHSGIAKNLFHEANAS